MPKGFFSGSTLAKSKAPVSRVPLCGACGLFKHCKTPKMEPTGKGRSKILLLGEAPGQDEDKRSIQFIGASGQYLRKVFRKYRIDFEQDCIKTNAIICHPEGNKTPTSDQIQYCRPNLLKAIDQHKPEKIITFGGPAIQSLLGHYWKEDVGAVSRWVGWKIPLQSLNAWVFPTFHPAFILRERDKPSVAEKMFEHHLEHALQAHGRPWRTVPKYEDEVEIILDHRQAAKMIRHVIKKGGWAAWDLETNMLKPEGDNAQIISCSVCWEGKKTFAFLWKGEAVDAMWEFVRSPIMKIASNLKFEDRWSRRFLGSRVRNWGWDTMLAAHVIDNRKAITSVKFQALVLLGMVSYNEHIEPFLKSGSSREVNQILREIEVSDLLTYNGLDSLVEFHVAIKQMEVLKYARSKR